ncbi:putative nuclease HARBI1 [Diachasma alloeum]|uniref:putative nuclease HARBI1 n=1 Tax=Diachasma alloeum TaxID=454923 RepID=UPI0007381A22|nr:putative nuclease HARBI1 [Diachasma alloeum]
MNNAVEDNDSESEDCVIAYANSRAVQDAANRIHNYFEINIVISSEVQLQSNFRMFRNTFNWLFRELSPSLSSPRVCGRQTQHKMKKHLAVIWLLATPDSYRSIGDRFDMSKADLFKVFVKVITGLNTMVPRIIEWPNEARRRVIERSLAGVAGISGVVGIIDGTYVEMKAPQQHPEAYVNRKCFTFMTLQGICDHELLFPDVFTGYSSAVSDIRIFRNSDIYPKFRNNPQSYFEDHQRILGDKAYPINKLCLTPYIAHHALTRCETNFNTKHAKTRTAIERCWALLYGRFRCLSCLNMNRMDLVPATIVACCVIHNICRINEDDLTEVFEIEGQQHLQYIRDDDEIADDHELDILRQE